MKIAFILLVTHVAVFLAGLYIGARKMRSKDMAESAEELANRERK